MDAGLLPHFAALLQQNGIAIEEQKESAESAPFYASMKLHLCYQKVN